MNRTAVAGVCAWLVSACGQADVNRPIELTIRAEGKSATAGFQVFNTTFPNPQLSHCQGTPIETFEYSEAIPSPRGEAHEWHRVVDVGPGDEDRGDSLVICVFEGDRLRPLWHGLIRPADGKRLVRVECWVGDEFESDCEAGVLLPQ